MISIHARPGEGKTSVLQAVAKDTDCTREYVCIFISLGDETALQCHEMGNANRALALRVVWATLKEACGREGEPKLAWTTFLACCDSNKYCIRLEQAMNYYCEVAERASTPRLLLVDETAYALTIDPKAGRQMCAEVLWQLDTLQEESLRYHFGTHTIVVSTSVRSDVVLLRAPNSLQQIVYLTCEPFSKSTMVRLKGDWIAEMMKSKKGLNAISVEQYIHTHLVYSGGLPRAVKLVREKLFNPENDANPNFLQNSLAKYYSGLSWEVVLECLTGKRRAITDATAAECVAKFGVRYEGYIPTLPLFQLMQWMVSAKDKYDGGVEKAVAELLSNGIPKLAHNLASVSNAGSQPLQFEKLTQIHEAVLHLVLHNQNVGISKMFPTRGTHHNMPDETMFKLQKCSIDRESVFDYPQDVAQMDATFKERYAKGMTMVVPRNSSNEAVAYGVVEEIRFGDDDDEEPWESIEQLSQNKFSSAASISEVTEAIRAVKGTRKMKKLAVIYAKNHYKKEEAPQLPPFGTRCV